MTLLDRIQQEIKAAMVAKDALRLETLRMLKSSIGYAQIEQKKEDFSDSEVIVMVQKELKKRQDSIEQFEKGGRMDLAAKEREEAKILGTLLPPPLSAEELEAMVRSAILEVGATDKKQMGLVIKAVQAKAGGRADGKTISGVVGRILQ